MATGFNTGHDSSSRSSPGTFTSPAWLQWVLVKNAIVFDELQFLTFKKKGAYFLIGPNQCGKSSLFEMIRRCWSTTKNTSLSSFFDDKRPLIVISAYKLENIDIISTLVGMSLEGDDKHRHVKLACEFFDGKIQKKGADTVSVNGGTLDANPLLSTVPGFDEVFDELIATKATLEEQETLHSGNRVNIEGKVQDLVESVRKLLKNAAVMSNHNSVDKTDCNMILDSLKGKVVHVFGNRSIGSLQWSESDRISSEYKDENYQSPCTKAEIICYWYKEEKSLTQAEKDKEKKYFDILTDGSNVEFILQKTTDNQLQLKVTKGGSDSELLKLSEGITEAKTCSIVLALERFSTILFEEPERGMHPQMINKLGDLILQHIKDKTILVTTHHPSFITTWNLERIFLFRPDLNKRSPRKAFKIIPVRLEEMNEQTKPLAGRFMSAREYSTVFYAARIIFVEGLSDEVFVTELKNVLIAEQELCKELLPGEDIKRFLKFLTGMDIINVAGNPNLEKFENMCRNFCIDCYFLEDTEKQKPDRTDKKSDSRKGSALSEKLEAGGGRNEEKVKTNWYRWKEGELEDVFVNFANRHDIDRSCSECHGRETLVQSHQGLSVNVRELIGVKEEDGRLKRKPQPKKGKFRPEADKSKVQEFLKCAIRISLDPEMEETEECKLLVGFVKFLVAAAKSVDL